MKRGFDSALYVKLQTKAILKRLKKFNRAYLEWGGKLLYDGHASRVLPGYDINAKAKILKKLKGSEIVYCISARDLQSKKVLGLKNFSYERQSLKDLRDIKKSGLKNSIVVITRFTNEPKARAFAKKLEKLGKKVYFHREVKGYGKNITKTLESYRNNSYVPIKSRLVVISGPAGGSGKMAFALSQIYHEKRQGLRSGYMKFETFPIWNLPPHHPINLAYEAATADLQDKVMIDPYEKKAHHISASNYNRDIQNFGLLQDITRRITKQKFPFGYKSPTDMGINMAKKAITNDAACREAAIKEIMRRNAAYKKEYAKEETGKKTLARMNEILRQAGLHADSIRNK